MGTPRLERRFLWSAGQPEKSRLTATPRPRILTEKQALFIIAQGITKGRRKAGAVVRIKNVKYSHGLRTIRSFTSDDQIFMVKRLESGISIQAVRRKSKGEGVPWPVAIIKGAGVRQGYVK